MNRASLAIGLIILLIGANVISTTAQDLRTPSPSSSKQGDTAIQSNSISLGSGFGLQSVILVSWDANGTQSPLPPGGPPLMVNLTLSYQTTSSSLFIGKLILLYCQATRQSVTVMVEIEETPGWCTATLSESQLQFPITGDVQEQIITLAVAVDEHAPAYALGYVRIHVSVDTLRGPFGLFPFVNGYDNTFTLSFVPGYLPHIIVVPASAHLNATPGNTSYLPINITNHGNARTAVMIEITEGLPGWIIYIPGQVIIDVNMSEETGLSVVPPSDFQGVESITISFTPYKADDYSQHGDPVYVTITIICEP